MNKDREIIEHLNKGDFNKAATELYKMFDSVYGILKSKGASVEDTKDLFQEAIMVLMRKISEEKEVINCTLKTYITTICKYQWNNRINKLSYKHTTNTDTFYADIENDVKDFEQEEQQFELIGKVLSKIGEKCKELLSLFYLDQKHMDEIAEIMKFSGVNSAKTQKYKCIEKARKMALEYSENSEKIEP